MYNCFEEELLELGYSLTEARDIIEELNEEYEKEIRGGN